MSFIFNNLPFMEKNGNTIWIKCQISNRILIDSLDISIPVHKYIENIGTFNTAIPQAVQFWYCIHGFSFVKQILDVHSLIVLTLLFALYVPIWFCSYGTVCKYYNLEYTYAFWRNFVSLLDLFCWSEVWIQAKATRQCFVWTFLGLFLLQSYLYDVILWYSGQKSIKNAYFCKLHDFES